ncbi:hypothetical protein [Catenulispora pinisilvae]|uniref:hypothetical protein n=1 Tax=Catenulispora pinisilvae TaxID=2705253 RepID=UPI001891308D|nr:hypothetical protein [Catenulispora pinisilvae]
MSQNTSDPQPATPLPATPRPVAPTPVPSRTARLAERLAALARLLIRVGHWLARRLPQVDFADLLSGRMPTVDLPAVLATLPKVEHHAGSDDDRLFEEASIGKVLLLMLRVSQESEYLLCRQVAEHALGSVPDPGALLG